MMKRSILNPIYSIALLFLGPTLLASPSFGNPNDSNDVSIGLVLSGGGAKCMAQIGALKVIEEAGIKIDYIGGTSMGAIVGAMYAMGYTVSEIEGYLRQVDWDALLTNETPRNRLSFFDRKAESKYLLSFPIEEGKVTLPRGLNYAQYILKQLSFITQQSYKYDSFSDFPIPFFCVATNLENGQMEIFEDGRLIDALRASSAFPSLFTPYEVNNKLYVDGGVVNNYPVKPLKEKDVDYIIGIDVQDFLYEKDELNSVVRVLEQTSSFINASELKSQSKYTDILIRPEVPGAGVTTFDMFDSIVREGERAARKKLAALKELAAIDVSKKIDRASIEAMPMYEFLVSKIKISGNELSTDDFVLSKLRVEEGEMCALYKLDKGLDNLYGSRYFKNVDYTITPMDTGYCLNINLKENTSLAQFRLGLHYDDDFSTAFLLNYTQRNLLFKNSRFSVDFALSENPRFQMDYFVDRGYIPTLGLKLRANRFKYRLYQNQDPIDQRTYLDFSADAFIQSTLNDVFAIGGGIRFSNVDIHLDFSPRDSIEAFRATSINTNANYIHYYGFIDFDSFDDANYPRKGSKFKARGAIISKQSNSRQFQEPSSVIDIDYSQAASLGSKANLVFRAFGATTIGPDLDAPYQIYLGSLGRNYINYIYPFIGYQYMEVPGRNALAVRADVYYQFIKNHYFIFRGNLGKVESTFDGLFGSDVILDGYGIAYSYDSPIGPLELNLTGSTNHSNIYTYISLGFWF